MREDMHYRLDYGERETGSLFIAEENEGDYAAGRSQGIVSLFWHFPGGKGSVQPWRRRLWELQNNSDLE